jgi:alkaline phosphatase D
MMGEAQERWLGRELARGGVAWNAIANQVMVAQLARGTPEAPTYSMDKWDGYVAARERLLRQLAGASNPIVLTGDIHSSWVADLATRPEDPTSPIVATEFIGTSMSSGGDGSDGSVARVQSMNPHIKFYNARRGYVRAEVTPSVWRSDYRLVPFVSKPGAPIDTRASFVVESGRPGVQRA